MIALLASSLQERANKTVLGVWVWEPVTHRRMLKQLPNSSHLLEKYDLPCNEEAWISVRWYVSILLYFWCISFKRNNCICFPFTLKVSSLWDDTKERAKQIVFDKVLVTLARFFYKRILLFLLSTFTYYHKVHTANTNNNNDNAVILYYHPSLFGLVGMCYLSNDKAIDVWTLILLHSLYTLLTTKARFFSL